MTDSVPQDSSSAVGAPGPDLVRLSDEQWRSVLTPEEFHILRQAGTEPPWSGEYVDTTEPGRYYCRGCGAALFDAHTKFASHCGWPSFYAPLPQTVTQIEDRSLGMVRTEVRCARCDGHLGHVFAGEGYATPTDLRYCINSLSVRHAPPDSPPPNPLDQASPDPDQPAPGA